MQNSSSFKQYGMPIIVLVVICIVISGALAATYSVANPIIIENTQKAADAARQELLADADAFTQYTGELFASEDGKVAVTDVYTANNGCGIVFTVETKSFGGVLVGYRFGSRDKQKAEITGGVVLILIGLKILLEGLGILP